MVESLRKGLSIFVVLALMCTVGTIGFVGFGYASFRSILRAMDTEPQPLPVPEVSEEHERSIAEIDARIRELTSDGAAGEVVVPAELFNSWIRLTSYRALRVIAEHAWFALEEDSVRANLAVPLDSFGAPGRFFNGTVAFSGALQDGSLQFALADIQPERDPGRAFSWLTKLISSQNIADAIGVDELLSEDVVERCSIHTSHSRLILACRERTHEP
jgi:hypothetical protein